MGFLQGWVSRAPSSLFFSVWQDFFPDLVESISADGAFAECWALSRELLRSSLGQVLLSSSCYRGESEAWSRHLSWSPSRAAISSCLSDLIQASQQYAKLLKGISFLEKPFMEDRLQIPAWFPVASLVGGSREPCEAHGGFPKPGENAGEGKILSLLLEPWRPAHSHPWPSRAGPQATLQGILLRS